MKIITYYFKTEILRVKRCLDRLTIQCKDLVTNLVKLRQQILYYLGGIVCSMYGLIYENLKLYLEM